MQFSDDMLDKHAAPDFSKLISAHIPDLSPKTVGAELWPARHLFVSTMDELAGKTVRSPQKQFCANLLYRARNAALAYSTGREKTLQCLAEPRGSASAVTAYFGALSEWEEVFSNVQKAFEIWQKGIGKGAPLFTKGDGSIHEKANAIVNAIKHDVALTSSTAVGPGLPMWLTNDGFQTVRSSMSWSELAEWVQDMIKSADDLMTPLGELASP